ncbi:MAG TPA: aromatic ring-hydroxylating dioxygenase subunit alpha [Steroidobacteraceae bacterium]|nr:aromatic ring-hydroxylating dioxygenase subunit alpha [Steroidobacteraceae bacterium]
MYDPRGVLELLDQAQPGHTLPQRFYTDPALFEFDMSALLPRSWLMLGFEAELPDAGSYFAVDFGAHSVLLVRGRDGVIRGFHNVCRHRGAQLCAEGDGKLARIVCPYHKWTYDLDGRLVGAARMMESFEFASYGLVPLRVELVEGCIYVALTAAAPDFAPYREALIPFLQPYRLRSARLAHQSVLLEKANWKLVMENARECYHCATSHPELKLSFPVVFNKGVTLADGAQQAAYTDTLQRLQLPAGPVAGSWWHIARYPLNAGVDSLSMTGRAVVAQRLFDTQGERIGGLRWATEPNSFCHAFVDYAFMFCAIPVGPQETRVISKWLVPAEAREGVDYRLEDLLEVWTKTNLQDRDLAENNQRGVNSLGYRPGPYSERAEDLVIRFSDWYRHTALEAARAQRSPSAATGAQVASAGA